MVRNLEIEPTKPSLGKVQRHFLALFRAGRNLVSAKEKLVSSRTSAAPAVSGLLPAMRSRRRPMLLSSSRHYEMWMRLATEEEPS